MPIPLQTYLKTTFILALGGVLFSGYLSAIKLFTGTCAFNESCPTFFGYPACWYGFGMFAAMCVIAVLALRDTITHRIAPKLIAGISLLGILFAGQYVWQEIALWLGPTAKTGYGLVFPICVYGLIFYIIIFILSLIALKSKK